ncbi:MAG: excinuclease ABC subunit UvrC [Lachnospiraceae bacterium]|nr:excinuclease ABC subunit UvrC [Lachnospiraceae bacterium]
MTNERIREDLKHLPHSPGVYLMRDEADTIMYVGKAIDLHKRVRSYFGQTVRGRGPQIAQMVSLVARFEVIVTDSELEALILENNLIKEHKPRYNTLLKDDKTYPYIRVSVQEDYPRVQFSRLLARDKARYFGPYTSAQTVRDVIDLVNRLFRLRTCNRKLPRDIGKDRPCLDYSLGLCCAPCEEGHVTGEEYRARVEGALSLLSGEDRALRMELKQKMEEASAAMAFEEAARYRDLLNGLELIRQTQKMTDEHMEDRDILAIALDAEQGDAVVQVFFVRDGKIIGREHFFMRVREEAQDEGEVLAEFVKQFYSGTPFIPREIMLPVHIPEETLLQEYLSERRGRRVVFRVPERGKKEKLMELASQNAQLVLQNDRDRLKREEGRTIGAVKEIADLLGLREASRMEAFDISNTSGFANVGSMVVYEKGKPRRSDYRKFRIRSVTGPDDYACMEEVLTRRFTHGLRERNELQETEDAGLNAFTRFPDLILMDGGKGQVHIAEKVLETLGLSIPVCGMVKDDRHRTRGLYFEDKEVPIDPRSEGFKLITRIQDEAHRFAITYHKSLRSEQQVKSVLDEIPGIGPARRKALMRHFASVAEIAAASAEALAEVDGISEAQAKTVYDYFHPAEAKQAVTGGEI